MIGRHRLDYSQIKVEDVPKLSKHHQQQYDIWAKAQERKKQIRNNNVHGFEECFAESCNVYSGGNKI